MTLWTRQLRACSGWDKETPTPRRTQGRWCAVGAGRADATEQPRTRPAPLCVLSRVSVWPVHKHGDEKKVGARREPVTAVFVSGLNFNGTGRLESRAFCAQQSENLRDRGWGVGRLGGHDLSARESLGLRLPWL